MDKRILVEPFARDGSPVMEVVPSWQGRVMRSRIKLAATHHPAIQAFLDVLRPDKNFQYVLSTPVGSHETFGGNANGDTFYRRSLENRKEKFAGLPYGYLTWLDAGAYLHHCNNDPEASFGCIKVAAFDREMDRCLVIVEHDRKKAASVHATDVVIEPIDDGVWPSLSMGCRVPFDRCSYCGGLSKTASTYCEHLNGLDSRYGKGRVLPDGRICLMVNDYPRFFDHSYVKRAAFAAAVVLEKVASKGAAMSKRLAPYARPILGRMALQDTKNPLAILRWRYGTLLGAQSGAKIAQVIASTAAAFGVVLTPQEFRELGVRADDARWLIHPDHVDPALFGDLEHQLPDRSIFHPYVMHRAVKLAGILDVKEPEPCGTKAYSAYREGLIHNLGGLLDHTTYAYRELYMDAFELVPAQAWAGKTAAVGSGTAMTLLAAIPLVFLASAHWRDSEREGEKLGMLEALVAHHPGFTSALLTGAALKGAGRAAAQG